MSSSRKIVQIFLASPSDLPDERQAAKAVVDAFNKEWAEYLGIQVELIGWEDTFKRFGRPQEQINLDLDRCEAFIGMLWRKWGTPPNKDGGPYTSGFEEEFERAIANRAKSGRPEMTLFLKKIDPDYLKDQGPDIKKVLAFKERIHSQHLILYEEFASLEEFEEKLSVWITRYVQQLKRQEEPQTADETKFEPTKALRTSQAVEQPSSTPLTPEGAEFVRAFVTKTEQDRETHPIESVEVARFRLLGTMIGTSGNDNSSLAVHDANILFGHRATVTLNPKEMEALIESGLDNIDSAVVPFWCWYEASNADASGYLSIASIVGPTSRRTGALKAMRLIGEPIKPLAPIGGEDNGLDRRHFIRSWLLPDRDDGVKVAALEYLAICGDETDLPILKAEFEKGKYQTGSAAADAIIRINLRQSRERAVRALFELQSESLRDSLIEMIFAKPDTLPTDLLLQGLSNRHPKVRSSVVTILVARGALPRDAAETLLEDSEASIRYDALRALMRDGRDISDDKAKSILIKPAKRAGLGALSGMFGTPLPSDTAGEAYAAQFIKLRLRAQNEAALEKLCASVTTILDPDPRLALDFRQFRTRATALRAAIDDDYKAEFGAAYADLEKRLIESNTLTRIKSHEDSLRKDFVQKAVALLCEKSEPTDLDRIRKAVSAGSVDFSSLEAQYFGKHGEWQDIRLLISLLDRNDTGTSLLSGLYDDDKLRLVAEVVHAIARGRFAELCALTMPSRLLARVIELASDREIRELNEDALFAMFGSETDDVRNAILPRVVKALSKTQLKRLLVAYEQYDGTRYYAVFYWLDLGISLPRPKVLHAVEVTTLKRR
jgi:hypothetical protein